MSKPCPICGRDTNTTVCVLCKLDPEKQQQVREIIQNKGHKAVTEKEDIMAGSNHPPCKACVEERVEKPKIRVQEGYCIAHYRQIVEGKEPYSRKRSEKSVTPDLKKRKYKKRTPDPPSLEALKDYKKPAGGLNLVNMLASVSGYSDLIKNKIQNVKKAVQELEALI